jgi:hypothetical protein
MLCEFAHAFPLWTARLLERDRGLTRNFREETITDVLMASLVGFEALGIRVDLPDEPTTGGDMEWIYAAPLEANGGRYLRLILQANRTQFTKLKGGGYWYYQHLDHGAGQQAQTLLAYASSSPGGMSTLPLYILYHPTSALAPIVPGRPAIEGINLVFASHIAPIVAGGCGRKEKKIDYWRNRFLPLSEILCWPVLATGPPAPVGADTTEFIVGSAEAVLTGLTGSFYPDLVARRLNRRVNTSPLIEPADGSGRSASADQEKTIG